MRSKPRYGLNRPSTALIVGGCSLRLVKLIGRAILSTSMIGKRRVTFGFEEFWSVAYESHIRQFGAVAELVSLANDMLGAAQTKAVEPIEKVIFMLARIVTSTAGDVVLLCGNGSGPSAMKIARGMFETSVVQSTCVEIRLRSKTISILAGFSCGGAISGCFLIAQPRQS